MLLARDDVGTGPALVLLHGFPLDRSMWNETRIALGTRFRVITPDLRGHGQSLASQEILTVDQMADDVIELLDSLDLNEPAFVGGLSMGGYVALSIAVRYPARVKGLLMINSRAEADSPEAAISREVTAKRLEASGDSNDFLDSMVSKLFAATTMQNNPDVVSHWRARMGRIAIRSLTSTLRGLAIRPDRSGDLAAITIPTLVIAGSDDQIVPRAETERMAELLPNERFVILPDAGHLSPLENFPAFYDALVDFLDHLD